MGPGRTPDMAYRDAGDAAVDPDLDREPPQERRSVPSRPPAPSLINLGLVLGTAGSMATQLGTAWPENVFQWVLLISGSAVLGFLSTFGAEGLNWLVSMIARGWNRRPPVRAAFLIVTTLVLGLAAGAVFGARG